MEQPSWMGWDPFLHQAAPQGAWQAAFPRMLCLGTNPHPGPGIFLPGGDHRDLGDAGFLTL